MGHDGYIMAILPDDLVKHGPGTSLHIDPGLAPWIRKIRFMLLPPHMVFRKCLPPVKVHITHVYLSKLRPEGDATIRTTADNLSSFCRPFQVAAEDSAKPTSL